MNLRTHGLDDHDSPSSVSPTVFRALCAFAVARRVSLDELAEAVGLSPAVLIAPHDRLPEQRLLDLVAFLQRRFPDEAVALSLVEVAPLNTFGELATAVTMAPDLSGAIDLFREHAALVTTSVKITREATKAGVRLAVDLAHDDLDGGFGAVVGLGMAVRVVRELLGFPDALLRVELKRGPKGPPARYEEVMGVAVHFDAPRDALVFRRSALAVPINPQAIASYRAAQAHLAATCRRLGQREEPAEIKRIRATIADLAVAGAYNVADLARALGVTPRTLQRHTRALGTSVRELIEEARLEHARQLLVDPHLSVYEISVMLGYSSESAFARAFRRWEGVSPAQHRRGAISPGGGAPGG